MMRIVSLLASAFTGGETSLQHSAFSDHTIILVLWTRMTTIDYSDDSQLDSVSMTMLFHIASVQELCVIKHRHFSRRYFTRRHMAHGHVTADGTLMWMDDFETEECGQRNSE